MVAALYQKSRVTPTDLLNERYLYGLGVACLSNEVAEYPFTHFPENIIGEEETARLIAENDRAEIAALLSNRNFAHKIEALYKNEGLFASLSDERRCGMVHLSIDNPRLITNESSEYGPDGEYIDIHEAILTMIASVPTTENWLRTLRALLDRLDPGDLSSPSEPITPILERWARAPASEKDTSKDGYFTTLSMRDEFRCLVAAMYGSHYYRGKDDMFTSSILGSPDSHDEIFRCAYYGNAQLTEKEMRSGFDRDQNVYLLAVLCNDSVYHKPALRKLLEEQLRGDLRYTYRRRCKQIHKRYPEFDPRPVSEWLIEKSPPESKELTILRQLEATVASITKAVKSVVKSVQTWIFWGSLVLGALGVALSLKRCIE